jgi:transcriptional regulator with XRE-family HTH domain
MSSIGSMPQMPRSSVTFRFTPDMGLRLRRLREEAGLSQGQLMLVAGRLGKGAAMVASRLERGKIPYPSLGLVADYLQACRVGFGAIADILDQATSKPVPLESRPRAEVEKVVARLRGPARQRVLSPTAQLALATPSSGSALVSAAEGPEQREERIKSFIAGLSAERAFEPVLARLLDSHNWSLTPKQREVLLTVMRQVFRLAAKWPRNIQRRFRKSIERGADRAARAGILDACFLAVSGELQEVVRRLDAALSHRRAIVALLKPTPRGRRASEARKAREWRESRVRAVTLPVINAANEALSDLRQSSASAYWQHIATTVAGVVLDRGTSVEWKRDEIEKVARGTKEPEAVRRAGEAAFAVWEKVKHRWPSESAQAPPTTDEMLDSFS